MLLCCPFNLLALAQRSGSILFMRTTISQVAISLVLILSWKSLPILGSFLNKNLVYIKIPKTAGSTTSGCIRRIAAHNGLAGVHNESWIVNEPGVSANHHSYRRLIFGIEALRKPAFIFTMVRDPLSRCLSEFYHFEFAKRRAVNSAANKIKALEGCRDAAFHYLAPRGSVSIVDLIPIYDLIGVTELFDESIVLLAHRLAEG